MTTTTGTHYSLRKNLFSALPPKKFRQAVRGTTLYTYSILYAVAIVLMMPTMTAREVALLLMVVAFCCVLETSSGAATIPSNNPRNHHMASTGRQGDLHDTEPRGYKILDNKVVYSGCRTVFKQKVKATNHDKELTFDIVGNRGSTTAVTVFAWDSKTKTATLVREYHPGPHEMLVGCAAGLVEDEKHNSNILTAAQDELEEECHLHNGRKWILLSNPIAMDKYSSTRIAAYLVLDSIRTPNPKPCDDEEDIEIVQNATPKEIMELIGEGKMNVVGSWVCLLALEKLRELGEL